MEDEDLQPTPQALFVNERFEYEDINKLLKTKPNRCVHKESHELDSGRLSPQDRIFADDYVIDPKRRKLDNDNNEKCDDIVPALDNSFRVTPEANFIVKIERDDIATSSDNSFQETPGANFVVKVERDDTEEDHHHHSNLVNPELNLDNLEDLGQKDPCDDRPVGDCEIKSEPGPEADRAALLKYYLSTTSALHGHEEDEGEASSSQNGASSSNMTEKHTKEIHQRNVDTLCRICCQRAQKHTDIQKRFPLFKTAKYERAILIYLNVDVSKDDHLVSKYLCKRCVSRIHNLRLLPSGPYAFKTARKLSAAGQDIWCDYDPYVTIDQCTVCALHKKQGKAGRPPKKRRRKEKLEEKTKCSSVSVEL